MPVIGSIYFVVKSSVLTFLIVCLLQVQFRDRTLEDRMMKFVRIKLAPQVLGNESMGIDHEKYRLSPSEMADLKNKIFESKALKGVRKGVKSLFFQEMANVMEEKKKKSKDKD